jgi:hypothetical protein
VLVGDQQRAEQPVRPALVLAARERGDGIEGEIVGLLHLRLVLLLRRRGILIEGEMGQVGILPGEGERGEGEEEDCGRNRGTAHHEVDTGIRPNPPVRGEETL